MNTNFPILVIAATKVGLQDVYMSDPSFKTSDYETTVFDDQRNKTTKISVPNPEMPSSFYFSIQVVNNLCFYSLYDSNIRDGLGRDGFIGFHIFCPSQYQISNFTSVLKSIHSEYNHHKTMSDALAGELLSKAVVQPVERNSIVVRPQTPPTGYVIFEPGMEASIESRSNSPDVLMLSKMYAFNRGNFRSEGAEQQGFLDVGNQKLYNEYKVVSDFGFIRKITVDGEAISPDKLQNKTSFSIIIPANKGNVIIEDDKKEKHYLRGTGENIIKRPVVPIKPASWDSHGRKKIDWEVLLIGLFAGILIGIGGFWGYGKIFNKPKTTVQAVEAKPFPDDAPPTDRGNEQNSEYLKPDFSKVEIAFVKSKNGNLYFNTKKGFDSIQNYYFGFGKKDKINIYSDSMAIRDSMRPDTILAVDKLGTFFAQKGIKVSEEDWRILLDKFQEKKKEIEKPVISTERELEKISRPQPINSPTNGAGTSKKPDENNPNVQNPDGVKPKI